MTTFETMFNTQEKDTIRHILKHWEPRVRDFAPSVYLEHYQTTNTLSRTQGDTPTYAT